MPLLVKLIFLAVLIVVVFIIVFVWIKRRRRKIWERLHLKLFLLRFPRQKTGNNDPLEDIALSERLFSAAHAFKKPIIFEVAVPHVGEEISFYASMPPDVAHSFARQVQSLWNNVQIEEVNDYNVFNSTGVTLAGRLKEKEKYVLPIRTYREIGSDTFQSILGGLAKTNEVGEGAAIQIIIKPAATSFKKAIKSALNLAKKGDKLEDVGMKSLFSETAKVIAGPPKTKNKEEKQVDEEIVKALESKLSKPLIEVNVRIVVSASSDFQAQAVFDGIVAGFSQFGAPKRNEFKIVKPRNVRKLTHKFSFREFDGDEELILNTEELASIFHFPTPFTEVPKVKFLKSTQLSPPIDLPKEGALLGESIYRGEKRKVYITEDDRRRHLYVIGQTGTGKSNLLINIVENDIKKGKGVAVVDPHGDLVEHILGIVPEDRMDDVIVFDPSSLDKPLGLNMLEYDFSRPEEKTFIVNEFVGIFDKLYDLKTTGGPMFEQYMRNALLLLMEDAPNEPATLMEIPRVFTDHEFRRRKLERIHNLTVVDFWEKEAAKAGGEAALSNITPYITSKFNTFTANEYMRLIVGQVQSAFSFRSVMDEGKILLVNLSKGKIGELNANLLGMIVVGKLLMAALGRADVREENRRDFNLFIDEFHNFTTDSIATILSEARKYRLNLMIAHQYIAQLKENIRDAVFGNVGSTIAFRVGAPDAEILIKQFEPALTTEDLVNVDNTHAYVKLLVGGMTTSPFNIQTFRASVPDINKADDLKELTREKYGMSREKVEKEIYKRLRE